MKTSERFLDLVKRILDGDDSKNVAQELEGVLIEEHLDDEQMDDLLYALSLYAPGDGPEYFDAHQLRIVLTETLRQLAIDDDT